MNIHHIVLDWLNSSENRNRIPRLLATPSQFELIKSTASIFRHPAEVDVIYFTLGESLMAVKEPKDD